MKAPLFFALAFICVEASGAELPAATAASQSIAVDNETWAFAELVHETFADATWSDRWIVEGDPACEAHGGRLRVVTSEKPDSKKSATLWWRDALPADILVEMTAGADLPADENAANLNLFFHARESDGRPYQFGRSSAYADYQKIPNYIITLTGGFQEGWSRVRRDPGFTILSEEKSTRSEPGRTYKIRAMITEGRIRYWLDDRLIHDARDPQPLPGGHFALRTWRSRVWWSNIRISALTRATPAPPATSWFKSGFESGTTLVPNEPARKLDHFAGRDAATGPVSQWIDDFEIWPDFPADATPRDESRTGRSTFSPSIADSPAASSPGPAFQPKS